MSHVETEDLEIAFLETGAQHGKAVLLLHGWSVPETGAGLLVVLIVTEGLRLTVVVTVNRLRKHLAMKRGTTAVAMRERWCLSIMQDARLQPSFLRKAALSASRK
jgi:hypothetical protein